MLDLVESVLSAVIPCVLIIIQTAARVISAKQHRLAQSKNR